VYDEGWMSPLANLLEAEAERIVVRWTERVDDRPPGAPAAEASHRELRDHLPDLLRELVAALRTEDVPSGRAVPREPQRRRHRVGFDLEAFVREHALLRSLVLDLVEEAGCPLSLTDVRVLTDVIGASIAEGVSEDARQQEREEERIEAEREALLQQTAAARAAAEAERQKLDSLLMQAPVAIAIHEGPGHTYTFANPRYRAIVGNRDVVGKPILEALPELAGQGFDVLLDRVVATGETHVDNEAPARVDRRGDGTLEDGFFKIAFVAKRNARGEVDGVLQCAFEVTDEVRSRQTLEVLARQVQTSEAELRLVMDSIPVLVSFVGKDERYRTVNRAYEDWFGLPPAALRGKALKEVIGDAAYGVLSPYVHRALAGELLTLEQRGVPYRHGGTRDVRVTFVPHRDGLGEVSGYVALLEDVTARRRLEEEREALLAREIEARERAEALTERLRVNEEQLRQVMKAAGAGIWEVDPRSLEATADGRFRELFSLTPDEPFSVEKGLAIIHPEDRSRVAQAITDAIAGKDGGQYHAEYRVRRAPGDPSRWLEARGQALFGADGKAVRFLGTGIDITWRKQVEQEREIVLRLEQQARIEAEEASRLKDEFLATVSHELRTPLNAMLGWAQMLRAGTVPDDRRERALETIERNARSQTQLIDDLLDMSRILAGKLRLEVEPLDVGVIVGAALDSIRPTAHAKGIRIQPTLDSSGVVMGDPNRLQQVVWNLLTNAVKFTPKGGRVQVVVQCVDSSVDLSVADTGQGISAEFLPHVFERFRQAEGGASRLKGGLGLGLSIVRQLVEMHGGTIAASSDGEGKGASFTVRLPLAVTRRHPLTPFDVPADASTATLPRKLEGLRVLVVDDEEDARQMVAFLLEASGASVDQASSAEEGRRSFAAQRPDVVVSDVGMPGENGYAFITSIRQLTLEQGGNVPAVALTAYARSEDRTKALTSGFTNHVAKPIEPAELIAVVASLARHRISST